MTEAELVERTLTLVHQAQLPTIMGLGETWLIASAYSRQMPPNALERYKSIVSEMEPGFPDDAIEFSHGLSMPPTRYLLLRKSSEAMAA